MQLSDAYRNDTISKNTQIIPLVIIEKQNPNLGLCTISVLPEITQITTASECENQGGSFDPNHEDSHFRQLISTHNIEIDGNYFEPLLLDVPKFSQSIDFVEGKFKITSLNLTISNVEYNGSKRMSERFDELSLINSVVCIHHKTPNCTNIQMPDQDVNGVVSENTDPSVGCPRVFAGVVRGISHKKDKITLKIEDITDKKITKSLPNDRLGSTNNIPEKYQNSPIPMFYGDLQNAPTIAYYEGSNLLFRADSKPINLVRYDEVGGGIPWIYNSLKIYSSEYIPITKLVHNEFVSEDESTIEVPFYSANQTDSQGNPISQYIIGDEGTISFRSTSMMIAANRVEAVRKGSPKSISLLRNGNQIIDGTDPGPSEESQGGTMYFDDANDYQHITQDEYNIMTDGSYTTNNNENHTTHYYFSSYPVLYGLVQKLAVLFSLQWDSGVTGAKFLRIISNRINNIKIPVRGDEHLPADYGVWNINNDILYVSSSPEILASEGWGNIVDAGSTNGHAVTTTEANMLNLVSFSIFGQEDWNNWNHWTSSNPTLHYNENAPLKIDVSGFTEKTVYDELAGETLIYNRPDFLPTIRLGHDTHSMPTVGKGYSSLEFCVSNLGRYALNHLGQSVPSGGGIDVNIDLDIQELETISLVNFDNAIERDYYLNARGRYDDFLNQYEHIGYQGFSDFDNPDILENPADIIRHILVEECGVNNNEFDENEFNDAWCSRQNEQVAYSNYIKLAFSVNEEIDSKQILTQITKNSLIYPYIKSNGKVGFITKKQGFVLHDYKYYATEIDNDKIIDYKFDLTKSTEMVSKFDVEYGYDYAQKKNLKITDPIQMTEDELIWHSINDVEDNYETYKADYIQDEASAIQLRNLIFYDRKSQHLEIDLTLPLSYADLELGSLCKFPINKLIDGMKAHGINYTVPYVVGSTDANDGVLRMPLFRVINISKNLDNVKCKLHQLHWLDNLENANGELWRFGSIDWESNIEFSDYIDTSGDITDITGMLEPQFPQDPVAFDIGINSFGDYQAVVESEAFTGQSGEFELDWAVGTSYVRHFVIDDSRIRNNPYGEYTGLLADSDLEWEGNYNYIYLNWATDNFENLFGESNFLHIWNRLNNPSIDPNYINGSLDFTQGYVYNPITIYMYRHPNYQNETNDVIPYILKFQNVAGTEFDEEHEMYQDVPIYESYWYSNIPDYLSPPDLSLPHKMMWVAYKEDGTLHKAGQNIGQDKDIIGESGEEFKKWFRRNLQIKFMIWQYETSGYSSLVNNQYNRYVFEMHLDQDFNDFFSSEVTVDYNAGYSGEFFPLIEQSYYDYYIDNTGGSGGGTGGSPQEDSLGDVNLDGNLNVLDAVMLAAYVLGNTDLSNESLLNADMNQDEIVDILDVVILINIILGNE